MGKHISEDEIKWILSVESTEAQQKIYQLTKSNKELTKANKDRLKEMINLEKEGKKESEAYKNLENVINKNNESISKNNESIKLLTGTLKINELTMVQLKQKARDLQNQLDHTSQATDPKNYKTLSTELTTVKSRMNELRDSGQNVHAGFTKLKELLPTISLAGIIAGMVALGKSSTEAALETEKSSQRLLFAVKNVAKGSGGDFDKLKKQATDLMGIFDDEDIKDAQTTMLNYGLSVRSVLELMPLMVDAGAESGKSLDEIANAVNKGIESGAKARSALGQLGIIFKDTGNYANNYSKVVEGLTKFTNGNTDALKSQWGEVQRSKIEWEEVKKALGAVLLKAVVPLADGLVHLKDVFVSTMDKISARRDRIASSRLDDFKTYMNQQKDKIQYINQEIEAERGIYRQRQTRISQISSEIQRNNQLGGSWKKNNKHLEEERKDLQESVNSSIAYVNKLAGLRQELREGPDFSIFSDDRNKNKSTKDKSDPNAVALKNLDTAHEAELNKIRLAGQQKEQTETQINQNIYAAEQKYYNDRITLLEGFAASAKKASKKAEYNNQIVSDKTKLLEIEKNIDQSRIDEVKKNRDDALTIEANSSKSTQIDLSRRLSEKEITQEQYDMLMQANDVASANNRLDIEKKYLSDVNALELHNGNLKAEAIKTANDAVMNADVAAASARAAQLKTLNNLVRDFKAQFKLTTVDEDLAAQMKVLDASYQARKEVAIKQNLDTTELDKAYLQAKEQLYEDSEARINQVRSQYGLLNQQQQFDLELVQLKKNLDQKLLTQEEYENAVKNLKRDSYKKQFDYYLKLFSEAFSALQQSEMDQIDAKYDVEIEAAKGNSEEVEKLENEKEQKKLDVQKKYADVNFAIKVSQIIADTAVSIMKAYADLGPIAGTVAAALLGVTGAAQLISAKAERDKVKNMTIGSSSSSSGSTGTLTASGLEDGGYVDVTRAQDGKRYSRTLYDPSRRGFVDSPTVIVGDGSTGRSREWVASNDAVSNPTIAPLLSILDKHQQAGTIRTLDLNQVIRANMAGYASGGFIDKRSVVPLSGKDTSMNINTANKTDAVLRELTATIKSLQENGISADVSLTDLERKQNLRNKARNIGTKK